MIENVLKTEHGSNALLFYKDDPFRQKDFMSNYDWSHTNNAEIWYSAQIFSELGFNLDVIDRNENPRNIHIKKSYDIFLGLGVGNTGKHFPDLAKMSGAKKKVLLSMGPQPDISNARVLERYNFFNSRHGVNAPPQRLVQEVIGENWKKIYDSCTHIMNIGPEDSRSALSFGVDKKIISFFPAIKPLQFHDYGDRSGYFLFAGNGFICKGVDVVVDIFAEEANREKNLYIAGPNNEHHFFSVYKEKLSLPNIHYLGFIEPGGKTYEETVKKCLFAIMHPSAEGCCTSLATIASSGLIPIVSEWAGHGHHADGFIMRDQDIHQEIRDGMKWSDSLSDDDIFFHKNLLRKRMQYYTVKGYVESYKKGILEILND